MGSFWANYVLLEWKKYRGVIFHDTEEWCKIWKKLPCCLENGMRNFANFHQSTWKCQNWNFDKIFLWKTYELQIRKCMSFKFTVDLCVMTMKSDTKSQEELTFRFKIDMNFTNFDRSSQNVWKFFLFNWLLVTKVYIVWATEVQRSYLSWHWGVIQILEKDWPVV